MKGEGICHPERSEGSIHDTEKLKCMKKGRSRPSPTRSFNVSIPVTGYRLQITS